MILKQSWIQTVRWLIVWIVRTRSCSFSFDANTQTHTTDADEAHPENNAMTEHADKSGTLARHTSTESTHTDKSGVCYCTEPYIGADKLT